MALVIADRVKETSTTTGTGALTLLGAVTGFDAVSDKLSTNDTSYFACVHRTADEWEVFLGTRNGAASVARTTVLASSNGGSAVNFSAGTKDVFIVIPASIFTEYGISLLDSADASAARTLLGLGTLATQSGTFSGTSSGTNTGDQSLFSKIAVSGQSDVVADTTTDTLTLVAGSNITITTDAGADSITIAASGGGGGSVATDTIFDAKGDLAVGTGSDTASRLAVGSNGQVLTADSGEATGLKWTTVAGTGDVTAASNFGTDNVLVRADGTGKGVQATGISVADTSNNVTGMGTLACGAITSTGVFSIGTSNAATVGSIELGHATDTTIARSGAGDITIEGNAVYRAGGTDVALADGGTGASLTDPNADRIMFWDDSAGGVTWLEAGNGLTITTTSIAVDAASTTVDGIVELATSAEVRTATDTTRALGVAETWGAAALVSLTDAATVAVDMSAGINFSFTIGGNRTLGNPTNTTVGKTGCIVVTQDGTGSRTLAYSSNWEFAGGTAPVLSTTANAKDILFYWVQSSTSIVITGILKAVA